jgi:two-component system, chemotaxis family, protein-glutamate methylesterase/glutaminase
LHIHLVHSATDNAAQTEQPSLMHEPKLHEPKTYAQNSSIKVVIVDDSVVVRGLVSRWLRETPGLDVVGTFRSGREIIANIANTNPDIIILDIEMADIDGLTALPHIMRAKPDVTVIVASTLTARNADISFKCMSLGAKDYVLKPQTNREVSTSNEFKDLLIAKIFALGNKAKQKVERRKIDTQHVPERRVQRLDTSVGVNRASQLTRAPFDVPPMRPFSRTAPKLLLIGASTGGPQAIMAILKNMHDTLNKFPVLIAQHMPAAFTMMFAEHLTRQTQLDVVQATHGEILKPGRVYIAPGGRHMTVGQSQGHNQISITDDAPVNFCKPSVDVLFESCAKLFGPACLSVMLTGMGSDGAKGSSIIADVGGSVIAQDEASSIVWGMPGSTVKAGACAAILSLDQMIPVITRLLTGNLS